MILFLFRNILADDFSRPLRHRRRQQEAMPVRAVDEDGPTVLGDIRQIIGVSRTNAGSSLDDFRFPEGRMHGIGGVQELHHRAGGNGARIFRFDHRRTHHETARLTRHDVKRNARMQQPDGTGQGNL